MLKFFLCLVFCVVAMSIDITDPNINVPFYIEHMLDLEPNNFTSLTELVEAANKFRLIHNLPLPGMNSGNITIEP